MGNRKSGKSTLAKYLATNNSVKHINYTDDIKWELAQALAKYSPMFWNVEHAYKNLTEYKDSYRSIVIAWADVCGWSDGAKLDKRLSSLWVEGEPSWCIDNIRYPEQASIAKAYGFKLVRLEGGEHVDIPSERAMDDYPVDLTLEWLPVEDRAHNIMFNFS